MATNAECYVAVSRADVSGDWDSIDRWKGEMVITSSIDLGPFEMPPVKQFVFLFFLLPTVPESLLQRSLDPARTPVLSQINSIRTIPTCFYKMEQQNCKFISLIYIIFSLFISLFDSQLFPPLPSFPLSSHPLPSSPPSPSLPTTFPPLSSPLLTPHFHSSALLLYFPSSPLWFYPRLLCSSCFAFRNNFGAGRNLYTFLQ